MSVWLKIKFIVLIIIGFLAGFIFGIWNSLLTTPLVKKHQKPVIYIVRSGYSVKRIAKQLYKKKLIKHPKLFEIYARYKGIDKHIQIGEYKISPGMLVGEFLKDIEEGKVFMHRITIIEGWTFDRMMKKINHNKFLEHTLKGLSNKEIMKELGYPNQHPEGRFFPSTYRFAMSALDTTILKQAYYQLKKRLKRAWNKRAPNLPYLNSYQALIVASMVEKETPVPKERPMVAGVIVRRLQKNMLLQIDATIIYGIKDRFNGNLTKQDLEQNTPYNTYVNRGLPPTPIALPGEAAIIAAVHPDESDTLYFVAKGDGSHVFSKSLKDHSNAVVKYQLNGVAKNKENENNNK